MIVHAYHGWASSTSVWDPLASSVGNEVILRRYDRGCFGAEVALPLGEKPDVVLAHSLGLHFVPYDALATAGRIIVLNGFVHFPSSDPIARRRTLSLLARMKSNLAVDPVAQVQAFCSTAKMNKPAFHAGKLNAELLAADLDLLATSSVAAAPLNAGASIHFLHATDDPIVNKSAIQDTVDAFPHADHRFIDCQSHNLPFLEADLIRTLIFAR